MVSGKIYAESNKTCLNKQFCISETGTEVELNPPLTSIDHGQVWRIWKDR